MNTDIIHEFGSEHDWTESFYFNFYDRGQDICGFMRLGLVPNRKEKSVLCYLLLPDGHIYNVVGSVPMENNDLEGLGLKLAMVEDEKTWKLTFAGEINDAIKAGEKQAGMFELNWRSINPVFDYRETAPGEKEKAAPVASERLEQYGKVTGKLQVGGKIYDVTALGARDHSWGVIDYAAPHRWFWFGAQFDENFALSISKVWLDEKTVYDGGYMYDEGKNRAIVRIDSVIEETDRGSPAYIYMAMYDKDGEVLGVKAKVENCALQVVTGKEGKVLAKMQQCLSKFTVSDGDDVGFGVLEYSSKRK